jgi:hypothetical protein
VPGKATAQAAIPQAKRETNAPHAVSKARHETEHKLARGWTMLLTAAAAGKEHVMYMSQMHTHIAQAQK